MADYVDRLFTELVADTSGHDPKIRTSTELVKRSMSEVERSANKAEAAVRTGAASMSKSLDQTAQRSRLLGYQLSDIGAQLAGGSNPFMIIAQQAPQVANALEGTTGAAGRLATFFSGPWGAALLAAGSLLGVMITRQNDASRASAQQESASQTLTRALRGEGDAVRSVTEAIRERERVSGEAIQTDIQRAEAARLAAIRDLDAARAIRQRTLAELQFQLARLQETSGTGDPGPYGELQALEQAGARDRIHQLLREIGDAEAGIRSAAREVLNTSVPIVLRQVEASTDGAARATLRYEQALARLNQQFQRGAISPQAYRQQARALQQQRDAAIEATREADRAARRADRSAANPTSQRQAYDSFTDALRGAGVNINSGYRTQAQQNALRRRLGSDAAVNSEHTNHAAVDLPLSVTDEQLYRIAANAGVRIRRIQRKPNARGGPHAHVTFGPDGGSGATQIERLEEDRARNEASFQDELAQLGGQLLQARRRSVQSAELQAEFEQEEIELGRQRANAGYEEAERQGRITAAQRQQLVSLNDQVAAELTNAARIRERQRLDEQAYRISLADLRDQSSIEQARGQLARTVAERRESEMRLLDLAHREELLAIERERSQEGLNQATRDRLDREEAAANQRFEIARQGISQRNMTPLQQFLDRAPSSAAELDEALEGVAANGLQSLNDGLAEAVSNFLGLGGVAGRIVDQMIADLIRLLAYRHITAPLAGAVGGLFGGGGGGGSGLASLAGSLFGGGKASGGPVQAGKFYKVGENGEELFAPGVNGTIIPAARSFGAMPPNASAGAASQGLVRVQLELSGEIDERIIRVSGPVALEVTRAEAPRTAAQAKAETMRALTRQSLG